MAEPDLYLRNLLKQVEKEKVENTKMSLLVASATTLSVSANSVSAEQVQGQYQFLGKGRITLVAKSSVTGLNVTCSINGIPLVSDLPISWFGSTGSMSVNDNVLLSQVQKSGGYLSLFLLLLLLLLLVPLFIKSLFCFSKSLFLFCSYKLIPEETALYETPPTSKAIAAAP